MSNTKISQAIILVVSLLTSASLWADVRASLSRQAIYEGDTVTLNIVTNEAGQGIDPDLSVLQQDFDIVATGSSQQTQIINGHRSESHQWHIDLAPKRGGELTVPSILVGTEATQALTLTVTAQPEAPVGEAGQAVFMKVQFEPADATVYVQQQIRYTLQLFYRERLFEGSLDGPHIEHALVERLGDDLQYQTTIDGQEYQVLERHYAIFPEQSGPLTVSPVIFNGRWPGKSQQRMPSTNMSHMMERFFGNSALTTPGKRIRLRSESFTVDVQPRPDTYSGAYWLPAERLTLTDSWASGPPEFRHGEPVTRTITLEAKGLESTHLPDISLEDSTGMRLYPEKPVDSNRSDGEWVIGSRQFSVAYVPSATGMLTIPAIQLDWWDSTEEKQQTAELPAWTVNVLPGNTVTDSTPPLTAAVVEPGQAVEVPDIPSDETGTGKERTAFKAYWAWLPGGVLLLAAGLFFLRRNKADDAAAHPAAKPAKRQLKAAHSAVQQACQQNNAAAAAKALLQWAAASWPEDPPHNLGALVQRLSTGVNEIQALERALYSAAGEPWQGAALWRVFAAGLQTRAEQKATAREGLSPLYPDWNS